MVLRQGGIAMPAMIESASESEFKQLIVARAFEVHRWHTEERQ
ncbi:hypothetical protein [Alcaligenes faecalis]|nr:hypothetical protein [Alcaligenes faecalis]MCR4143674.1 hypothetical protein [Alcaligenes faecalis]WGQ35350.1 hypothetical protein QEZ63_16000 [Alcaligenes faecalis]